MNYSLTPKHIAELWRRMTAIYGHKWLSSYGPSDVDGTWQRGLNGLDPHDLAAGLQACIESGEDWPPTLPAFRKLCRPTKHAIHELLPTLPAPQITREQQLEHVAACRKALA